jgi:hypothetical protein
MASRAWTDPELDVLREHVGADDWLRRVGSKLRHRTAKALKVRMARMRAECGLGDGRCTDDDDDMEEFNRRAVIASQQLREATLRVGIWA